jgi:hypothetical protein
MFHPLMPARYFKSQVKQRTATPLQACGAGMRTLCLTLYQSQSEALLACCMRMLVRASQCRFTCLLACEFIRLCVFWCLCACFSECVCLFDFVCLLEFVCLCEFVSLFAFVCLFEFVCLFVFVCLCVCVYWLLRVHIHSNVSFHAYPQYFSFFFF